MGAVDVWELATGEHRSTIPVPFVDDVAWSPDGDLLAIANGAALSVFDGSGKERAVLRGEPGVFFMSVRFDATGSQLVSTQTWTGRPDFSLLGVRVWDWARGESVRTIETPAENAVFAPDGESILASNIERGRAELFDAASGEMVATLSGHTGVVMDMEFSPDGSLIATSGSDATVRIWDGASGAPRVVLRGHEQRGRQRDVLTRRQRARLHRRRRHRARLGARPRRPRRDRRAQGDPLAHRRRVPPVPARRCVRIRLSDTGRRRCHGTATPSEPRCHGLFDAARVIHRCHTGS